MMMLCSNSHHTSTSPKMSLLLRLPDILAVEVTSDWLEPTELAELDTAICNSKERPNFLSLLKCPAFSIHRSEYWENEETMDWIVLRGMKLQLMVQLRRDSGYDIMEKFAGLDSSKIWKIILFECSQLSSEDLIKIINACPSVHILMLKGLSGLCDDVITGIDENIMNQLTMLDLSYNPTKVTSVTLKHIEKHCTKLRSFAFGPQYEFRSNTFLEEGEHELHILEILKRNPSLESLKLNTMMHPVTDEILYIISQYCKGFLSLSLENADLLTWDAVVDFLEQNDSINEIELRRTPPPHEKTHKSTFRYKSGWNKEHTGNCTKVEFKSFCVGTKEDFSKGLIRFFESSICDFITNISFFGMHGVTDAVIDAISENVRGLEKIHLSFSDNSFELTAESLVTMMRECVYIDTVSLCSLRLIDIGDLVEMFTTNECSNLTALKLDFFQDLEEHHICEILTTNPQFELVDFQSSNPYCYENVRKFVRKHKLKTKMVRFGGDIEGVDRDDDTYRGRFNFH